MKHAGIVTALATSIGASLALAQPVTLPLTPAPAPLSMQTPQEQTPAKPVAVRPNRQSKANTDARACLERADNLQVIVCAERFR